MLDDRLLEALWEDKEGLVSFRYGGEGKLRSGRLRHGHSFAGPLGGEVVQQVEFWVDDVSYNWPVRVVLKEDSPSPGASSEIA